MSTGESSSPDDHGPLIASWRAEETGPSTGWDFSHLEGRMVQSAEPWDLDALYRHHLTRATSVLDMGTGGGEHLIRFAQALPRDTVATEGWAPNVGVAAANLRPYGVQVVQFGQPDDQVEPEPMPFADDRFGLILNRHEAYHADEVARVLTPGGYFLTQQVGGEEFTVVREALGHRPRAPQVRYDVHREHLADAGLEVVDGAESAGWYEFGDVAALVAYLQLVPWDAPEDFSVDAYTDQLLALHAAGPARGEPVRASRIRFWLLARKA